MPVVEVRTSPRRNELVDPLLWQLHHELASDQHREDLSVDTQHVAGAEHLPSVTDRSRANALTTGAKLAGREDASGCSAGTPAAGSARGPAPSGSAAGA